MIRDAEKFAEQDKELKEKIDAKNSLENYIYTMKNTIEDKEKLADKIDSDDKSKIKDALQDSQDWLSSHDDADKDDYETQLKDLQSICDPIISKVYQKQGG
jgi:heat shock protein 5